MPFAKALAHKWLDPGDVFEQTVILAGDALMACYDCLSHDQIFARDLLKKALRGVLQLYGGVGGQVTPSSVEDQAPNRSFSTHVRSDGVASEGVVDVPRRGLRRVPCRSESEPRGRQVPSSCGNKGAYKVRSEQSRAIVVI